jgi:hypothetical protein
MTGSSLICPELRDVEMLSRSLCRWFAFQFNGPGVTQLDRLVVSLFRAVRQYGCVAIQDTVNRRIAPGAMSDAARARSVVV